MLCLRAVAQPTIPFATQVIDAQNSGDCKALGDIDLDGKADPIVGGSSLSWYESGAGFAKRMIRFHPLHKEFTTDCQAVDLDGDSDIDIVIGDGAGTNNILWYDNPLRNSPHGVTGDPRIGGDWVVHAIGTHGATVHDIEVADLDNDGVKEVVTSGHGFTHVWKRSGSGWIDSDLSSQAGQGVFLGDVDRDGMVDVATPTGWIRNPGDIVSGTWQKFAVSQAVTGDECLLADLDGDGRLDLITCDAHNRSAFDWFQQPAIATSAAWTRRVIDNAMGSHHLEAADFNRDGRMDILAGLELSEIAVYLNPGGSPPTFFKQTIGGTGHNARRGDINGDGFQDILACDYIGHPPVRVYINQSVMACYANCDGSTGQSLLTAGDFMCFLNSFVAGEGYANCDESATVPVLNAMDFQCFLGKFVAGCS